MKYIKISIVILILSFNSFGFFDSEPVFKKISLKEGLSHTNIYELFQDHKGFIWIGTEHGLCRYDGYNLLNYYHNPTDSNSISENDISCVEQLGNTLWIGTWGGGLNSLNLKTGQFKQFKHTPDDSQSISGNRIIKIIVRNGRLWVATFNNGLNLLDPDTETFTRFTHNENDSDSLTDNRVWDITLDSMGTFWIGNRKGLCRFFPEKQICSAVIPSDTLLASMLNSRIRRFRHDKNGLIWILTQKGICSLNPEKETLAITPLMTQINNQETIFNDVFIEENGDVWLGTAGKGVIWMTDSGKVTKQFIPDPSDPDSISSNDIRKFLKDRSGNLWMGSRYGGINIVNTNAAFIRKIKHNPYNKKSLSSNNVRSIYKDGTTLYLATSNALNLINLDTGTIKHFTKTDHPESLPYNITSTVLKTSDGTLWVSTFGGGLSIFNPEKQTFKKLSEMLPADVSAPGVIVTLYESSDSTLWIGSVDGLYSFNLISKKLTRYSKSDEPDSLSDNIVRSICEDDSGSIWAGTDHGLNILNPETNTFKRIFRDQHSETINSNIIHTLFKDSKGDIWIGSSSGVNVFKKNTQVFINPIDNASLLTNMVLSIIEDHNTGMWIGTQNGLFYLNRVNNHLQVFNENNGLPSASFFENASFKDEKGVLYFGTSSGLISLDPEEIKPNSTLPEIVLTSCRILNREPIDDYSACFVNSIELNHKNKSIELTFSALDYTCFQKQQYAFKLENYEKEWKYTGTKRTVNYANLPEGEYTLKVKAANSDGIWNEKGLSLHINVIPPFWQTLWFRLTIFFTLLLFISAAVYYRIITIKRQKEALEIKVKEAMENIKILTGFIPICASCKKIRDDQGYWSQVEEYISKHSDAVFSHGICPECKKDIMKELEKYKKEAAEESSE